MKPYLEMNVIRYSIMINQNYYQFFKDYLVDPSMSEESISKSLYEASFVVLAHDGSEDPAFTYANRTAQELWGYSWREFMGMPSRLSAAPDYREDRGGFLKEVREKGYSSEYRGIRIDKNGRSFSIERVALWNLLDPKTGIGGQAACFKEWRYL